MSERVDKASLPLNQPRRTPSHPTKSHIVKTKVDGKEKILRFGEQGASTAGKPKAGESERMKAKRASFKARHARNIAKGQSSPAYWANKVKWAEGGAVSLDSLAAKYDDGGSVDPSMLRRLKNTLGSAASDVNRSFYENVSGPAVGSLVDMTVGLGDLAQMGAKYLGNRMGYDAGEFTPVAPRVKQALGVDNYNPYTVGGVAANLLPFARGKQALSAAATGLPRLFPNLGREAAAYGGSEAAAAGAREFMPDSPLVELAASAAGGSAAGGVGGSASRSPTVSNIVKAQGNLNLTPRARAEALKGSDTQTAESFLNQLRGQPGMTQAGFDDLVKRYQGLEPNTRMTKAEFEQRIPASQYNKIDLKKSAPSDVNLWKDAYASAMHDPEYVYGSMRERLGLTPLEEGNEAGLKDFGDGYLQFEELPPDIQQGFERLGMGSSLDPEVRLKKFQELSDESVFDVTRSNYSDLTGEHYEPQQEVFGDADGAPPAPINRLDLNHPDFSKTRAEALEEFENYYGVDWLDQGTPFSYFQFKNWPPAEIAELPTSQQEIIRSYLELKPDDPNLEKLWKYLRFSRRDDTQNPPSRLKKGNTGYAHQGDQRLMRFPNQTKNSYFELGVTHPNQKTRTYGHYQLYNDAKAGLVGHIRGTFIPADAKKSARMLKNNLVTKPNSMVIEEIQSDAQGRRGENATGELHQAHGTMFKAAIQHALENGADTVYYPSASEIAGVRDSPASSYAPIYDQQIVKEGLKPLLRIPGVSSRMLSGYHEIDFTPEAKDFILKGEGQAAPGYAHGGTVRAYDPQQIENIMSSINAPRNYASGGSVLAYDPGRVDAILNQFRGAV